MDSNESKHPLEMKVVVTCFGANPPTPYLKSKHIVLSAKGVICSASDFRTC